MGKCVQFAYKIVKTTVVKTIGSFRHIKYMSIVSNMILRSHNTTQYTILYYTVRYRFMQSEVNESENDTWENIRNSICGFGPFQLPPHKQYESYLNHPSLCLLW